MPPCGRRFRALPTFVACCWLAAGPVSSPVWARGERETAIVMYYRVRPGETLYDIGDRLDTSPSAVRRLNRHKIGLNGKIKPYAVLLIPTDPSHQGKVIGASSVDALAYARKKARQKPKPPKPKPAASKPEREAATAAATSRPAAPPKSIPASASAPPPAAPALPPPPDYGTRDTTINYDTAKEGNGIAGLVRFLLAFLVVCGAIPLVLRLIKRFGLAPHLANRFPAAAPPAPEAADGASGGVPFAQLLGAATAAAPAKNIPQTLQEPVVEADTSTGTPANAPAAPVPAPAAGLEQAPEDNDADDIPETSLEAALRARRACHQQQA